MNELRKYLFLKTISPDMISLAPVGHIKKELLEFLKNYLESLGFSVRIAEPLPLPERGYNKKRNQYLVYPFIDLVTVREHTLLITDVDLYALGLTFIFGYGPGPHAIISIARLKGTLLKERMIKEAVHELGHVFSLTHCDNPRCVMHFSTTVEDTDYKNKEFCATCQKAWSMNVKKGLP